ncbi:hypothetical protein [Streptomyces sp. NPDC094031]|uniref:hypothetical protein n=1 Tax=Streptomyces sp. NPDC094031 TaxID=3155307 RepID=UPI003331B3CA
MCVFSAERRLLVAQQSRTVLLAVVDEHLQDVDFWRTDEYRSFVPPLRAETSHGDYWRSMLVEGHPDGYIDWFSSCTARCRATSRPRASMTP